MLPSDRYLYRTPPIEDYEDPEPPAPMTPEQRERFDRAFSRELEAARAYRIAAGLQQPPGALIDTNA